MKLKIVSEILHHIKSSFYKISLGEIETNISKSQLSYFQKLIDEKLSSLTFGLALVLIAFLFYF